MAQVVVSERVGMSCAYETAEDGMPARRQATPSFFWRLVDEVVYWNVSFLSG